MEWWPELSQTLQEVRITGGEPSTSFNFWNFMDVMKMNSSPNLSLAINSNLGVEDKLIDKLIQTSHEIDVKNFDLYTSCEAYGDQAEYIRDGLKYDVWRKNVVRIIEEAKCRQLIIMMTINSLCLFSITEFLDDMILLKKKYGQYKLVVDLNILRWPAFMSPVSLPNDLKKLAHDKLKTWYQNKDNLSLLHEGEIAQILRLIDYVEVVEKGHIATENDLDKHFHDFKSFYEQYDIRRNKDFRKTFPELVEWYDSIVVDYSIPNVPISDGRITNYELGEYKGTNNGNGKLI